jgi:hypothetical protein
METGIFGSDTETNDEQSDTLYEIFLESSDSAFNTLKALEP